MRRDYLRGRFRGSGLSAAARFVFVMLDAHANAAGQAWQSVATLAEETGFGTTTVRAALRELEAAGEIVGESVRGQPTIYWLSTTRPEPQRQALGNPNGIRVEPQRNSGRTPTPGVAKGIEGVRKERGRSAALSTRASSAAAQSASPGPVTRRDGASFLPGTGWIA